MAIYHFKASLIKRSENQNAVKRAANNSRTQLVDENTGIKYHVSKSRKYMYSQLLFTKIFVPECSTDFRNKLLNRQLLWSIIESLEKRKDSQLARELLISLPFELTDEQRINLMSEFVVKDLVNDGFVVDLTIFQSNDNDKNYFAKVLITTRRLKNNMFGKKARDVNDKKYLIRLRKNFADLTNEYLSRYGHDGRVDHRNYQDKGLDMISPMNLSKEEYYLEKAGVRTKKGDRNREIAELNKRRS